MNDGIPDRPPVCPEPIGRTMLTNTWRRLAFLHWRYDPAEVQSLLPDGLTVDVADGSAWVALVPFEMQVGLWPFPPLPYLTVFPETNVRTYVKGPDGGNGVYFFSLDVNRPHVVATARGVWGVPYTWSTMSMDAEPTTPGSRWRYEATRRWPHKGRTSVVDVEIGEAVDEPSELENFLTGRWSLYERRFGRITKAKVDHPPWPLRRGRAIEVDDQLVEAAGFSTPQGEPDVLVSDAVDVRLGLPHVVGRSR